MDSTEVSNETCCARRQGQKLRLDEGRKKIPGRGKSSCALKGLVWITSSWRHLKLQGRRSGKLVVANRLSEGAVWIDRVLFGCMLSLHTHAPHHRPNSYLRLDTPIFLHIPHRSPSSNLCYQLPHPSSNPHLRLHTSILLHPQPCLHTTLVCCTHNGPISEPTKSIHQLPHRSPSSNLCYQLPHRSPNPHIGANKVDTPATTSSPQL